ncbi:NAD(P)/FAD-dependent oxidoreductase [Patulibacter minatonensis]|uniref:NAD(P)/FAD-dependent oxidoreductase n=1 Tax=Patulibacter minatonensis TaxID=298163 RepID=UPI000688E8C4|nr:NAD(P)/FAD-dependent oxidoreductase [Patulibacter minatonensis]
MSPKRATLRGAERTSIDGDRCDVLVCGASFAGLAVARELAGLGHDVLVLDRYEIGERQTSACAVPTPWLDALGVHEARRAELPYMSFTTPHGSARYRLPWTWTSFDYRTLCHELWAQAGEARFLTAKIQGRTRTADGHVVHTDRGDVSAPLVVDALGWRRTLATPHYQPPDAPLSRGLEVHPHVDPATQDDALDCWVDRSVVPRGYAWRVPAGEESRVGVGSYDPHHHVKEPTREVARRLDVEAVRYQGNWFPHKLRPAAEDDVFFCGDSAGHCIPVSGEGIRTAFLFGVQAAREIAKVLDGAQTRDEALVAYAAFSKTRAPFFRKLLLLQRVLPRIPPRLLTLGFRLVSPQWFIDRAFGWYLDAAHPEHALRDRPVRRSTDAVTPAAPVAAD